MFKLFRKRLEMETVAADIVEDFMDTQIRLMFQLLDKENYQYGSVEKSEETFAFVHFAVILGIELSHLKKIDQNGLSTAITNIWLEKLIRPIWEAAPFLQSRLEEYLHQYSNTKDITKLTQMYMDHLRINDSKHVAFLTAITYSMGGRVNAISDFLNDVNKNYNFSR